MGSDRFRRVLVVDDDPEIRSMLSTALRQKFLVIDEAEDGGAAIDLLREHAYSVVLLDILMPGTNGFAVLDHLADTPAEPTVVLVISGADRSMLEPLDARRIHGIIKKPFDPQEVAAVVAACADIRGRSAFETMAIATMMSGAPLIALLRQL